MARDGAFLPFAAKVHPRHRAPHIAILALGAVGVFRLRQTQPDRPCAYRVWGYPVVPIAYMLAPGRFVVNTTIERPTESLAGLGFVALGLPVYWYTKR